MQVKVAFLLNYYHTNWTVTQSQSTKYVWLDFTKGNRPCRSAKLYQFGQVSANRNFPIVLLSLLLGH